MVYFKISKRIFCKKSNMTLNEFKDFYYNVCNVDYNKMKIAMEPFKRINE